MSAVASVISLVQPSKGNHTERPLLFTACWCRVSCSLSV